MPAFQFPHEDCTCLRLVGPVMEGAADCGDGCYAVLFPDDRDLSSPLLWHFPFLDSGPRPMPCCGWLVLAGFATREAAEAYRRGWLAEEGSYAVDDVLMFHCVAELCRVERRRAHRRERRRSGVRSVLRRLGTGRN